MRLYVDLNGDRHYLMTDDGEAVYVDELKEEGRDTEYIDQAIELARVRRRGAKPARTAGSLEIETFGPGEEEPA